MFIKINHYIKSYQTKKEIKNVVYINTDSIKVIDDIEDDRPELICDDLNIFTDKESVVKIVNSVNKR